jgi:hypothetical protein
VRATGAQVGSGAAVRNKVNKERERWEEHAGAGRIRGGLGEGAGVEGVGVLKGGHLEGAGGGAGGSTVGNVRIRQMVPKDMDRMGPINDPCPFTETFPRSYYLTYMQRWPRLTLAAEVCLLT